MHTRVYSCSILGLEAYPVEVEVDVAGGISRIIIVGLPDEAVKESKDRVKSAIINSGFRFPAGRITVNLAPAAVKKIGPDFELAFALGILKGSHQMRPVRGHKYMVLGELALDGRVRRINGVLPRVIEAERRGVKGVIVPASNASEAAVVSGISVYPVSTVRDAVLFLTGAEGIEPYTVDLEKEFREKSASRLDMSEVKGQYAVKRALTVAVAGGHNIILIGPPGSGKTMLARRIPAISPPITIEESIETTMIYSIAGMLKRGQNIITQRPFRAPHHTISDTALAGGSSNPRPGEVSLSHNGVLFLDELPEFNRNVLEVLRQPMEEGSVTISRAKGTITFPAKFMLVAAMNPCPCGYFTHPAKECRCSPGHRQRYLSKISGPLLDRIDIQISVPPVEYGKIKNDNTSEGSDGIRYRIEKARRIQIMRFKGEGIFSNSRMSPKDMKRHCALTASAEELVGLAMTDLGLSARAYYKILKIARTIADMDDSPDIQKAHISEAIQYRVLDRETGL